MGSCRPAPRPHTAPAEKACPRGPDRHPQLGAKLMDPFARAVVGHDHKFDPLPAAPRIHCFTLFIRAAVGFCGQRIVRSDSSRVMPRCRNSSGGNLEKMPKQHIRHRPERNSYFAPFLHILFPVQQLSTLPQGDPLQLYLSVTLSKKNPPYLLHFHTARLCPCGPAASAHRVHTSAKQPAEFKPGAEFFLSAILGSTHPQRPTAGRKRSREAAIGEGLQAFWLTLNAPLPRIAGSFFPRLWKCCEKIARHFALPQNYRT